MISIRIPGTKRRLIFQGEKWEMVLVVIVMCGWLGMCAFHSGGPG